MADLTTLLSKFLVNLYAGTITLSGGLTASAVSVGDGTSSLPSFTFTSDPDTGMYSAGPDILRFVCGASTYLTLGSSQVASPLLLDSSVGLSASGANGQTTKILQLTELTTIAAAATTDTTIQMPAGAIVLAVNTRVTVAIPTAGTFTVGDSGSAARFNTGASVAVTLNTTDAGTKAGAYYNASALSVRITPNLTPGTNVGRVRVTITYILSTPPTS